MDWRIKAGLQKGLSLLPGGGRLQHWLQRRGLGSLALSDLFLQDRLAHVARHLRAWRSGRTEAGLPGCVWEIGTGWYPVVPLGLYLCGCNRIVSTDLRPLWQEVQVEALVQALLEGADALPQWLPEFQVERLRHLRALPSATGSWQERLQSLGIELTKGHRGTLPLPMGSCELVISNNTLEHVPAGELPGLLASCHRALRPGGVMSHYIDMVDHYSYVDPRVPAFHYLKFPSWQWRLIENRLQSQNRLRLSQYQALLAAAVWRPRLIEPEILPADALPKRLARPFERLVKDDLCTGYALWASTKLIDAPAAEATGASDNAMGKD